MICLVNTLTNSTEKLINDLIKQRLRVEIEKNVTDH